MIKASLLNGLEFGSSKPSISILFETENTKEVRIVFSTDQQMKEHKTPFPIVIEIVSGVIDFGVSGEKHITHNKKQRIIKKSGVTES